MAELAMLADTQRAVYPEEVTRQLHMMAQSRESLPVIDRRSYHCAYQPSEDFYSVGGLIKQMQSIAASVPKQQEDSTSNDSRTLHPN